MIKPLPSLIATRRIAYAKKLVQRRQAAKARRVRERAKAHTLAFVSICALALLLTLGLFLASAPTNQNFYRITIGWYRDFRHSRMISIEEKKPAGQVTTARAE